MSTRWCIDVNAQVPRVWWYRFRTTFGRRWGGYLALVVLVGAVGGLAMGALAGARRTQSSFPAYRASTHPSDLEIGGAQSYDPSLIARITRLPHITRVESYASVNELPLGPNGVPPAGLTSGDANGTGSIDGLLLDMDRATVTSGRMPDPARPDEVIVAAADARHFGLHVGQVIPVGFYTNDQINSPEFPSAAVPAHRRLDVRLVGIAVFNNALIQDDSDATSHLGLVFTPALTNQLLGCCANSIVTGIHVDRPSDIALVNGELLRLGVPSFEPGAVLVPKAELAIRPQAIALGVFGGIAALAVLLIAAQVIGRQSQADTEDLKILRALGAGPAMTAGDGLIGVLAAVVLGVLLAVVVAVALSPLTPVGPVRPVEPRAGLAFDWTVLALGALVLILALGVVALGAAYHGAPDRAANRGRRGTMRGSSLARSAASAGLPAPAVTGIRFALEAGEGRTAVPVRSAILGAALATVVLTATLTFGASLHTLVSHPALYGWNWDVELAAGQGTGAGDIPAQLATQLLNHDPDVAAWAGVYFGGLDIDGQVVPVLGGSPNAAVAPPLLTGRTVEAPDEIVLGATTLARLHTRVGDSVEARNGTDPATLLRVVGTATMPAIGSAAGGPHLEMGVGALVAYQLIPPATRNPFDNPVTGPNAIFVRFRPGSDRAAALASVRRIAQATSNVPNFGVSLVSVQRPAEIVNYRSMGATPVILGTGLALGAVSALALTLIASVRRRRRDLALLKALGFTRRQLAAVVAWQASVTVVLGGCVGAVLGIALGRSLWDVFADEIHVVPRSTVPGLSIALVAVGALVLANLVAGVPGRIAAGTPTALVLRAE